MSLKKRVIAVLETQALAVLGTSSNNIPHTTLVAFKADLQAREAYFVSSVASRKAQNIDENPYVSLFVDNRNNKVQDFRDALGVTMKGMARVAGSGHVEGFLEKHPHLFDFVHSPSTNLFLIDLDSVEVVTEFQKVFELNLDE